MDFNFDTQFYRRIISENQGTEYTPSLNQLVKTAVDQFYNEYDYYPNLAACAPGSFTLMGDHVEYAEGFVVQAALPLMTVVVGKKHATQKCSVTTTSQEVDHPRNVLFPVPTSECLKKGIPEWANYIRGITNHFHDDDLTGFDALIHSDIPIGRGYGSSAALQVAFYTFLEAVCGRKTTENDELKASSCKTCEEEFANSFTGQWNCFTSTMAVGQSGLLVDCETDETMLVNMRDPNILFLLAEPKIEVEIKKMDMAQKRELELKLAARLLGLNHVKEANPCHLKVLQRMTDLSQETVDKLLKEFGKNNEVRAIFIAELFDLPQDDSDPEMVAAQVGEDLTAISDDDQAILNAESPTDPTDPKTKDVERDMDESSSCTELTANIRLMHRLRHYLTENARSLSVLDDLATLDYVSLGYKLTQSHLSLKEDCQVCCPVLDQLVHICLDVDGVYGSKMSRGWTTLTMLSRNSVDAVVRSVKENFEGNVTFHLVFPSEGCRILNLRVKETIRSHLSGCYLRLDEVMKKAIENFDLTFDRMPTHGCYAPTAVSLLGDHNDYNQGFMLTMAVGMLVVIVGAINGTAKIRIANTSDVGEEPQKVIFQTPFLKPMIPGKVKWATYVRGVIAHFKGDVPGFDCLIQSSIPPDSGVSSNGALEVAMYTFLESLTGIYNTGVCEKAYLCMKAEHEFTKTLCGFTDQTLAIRAHEGFAVLLDCASAGVNNVPFQDPSVVLLLINSNSPYKATNATFLNRLEECYVAAAVLDLETLRDASEDDVQKLGELGADKDIVNRAKHIISENGRVLQAAEVLRNGDFVALGEIMVKSHLSLRDNFDISSPDLNFIVERALEVDGVLGARMTSMGCGTCALALVKRWAVDDLIEYVQDNFEGNPTFYLLESHEGSRSLSVKEYAESLTRLDFAFENVFPVKNFL